MRLRPLSAALLAAVVLASCGGGEPSAPPTDADTTIVGTAGLLYEPDVARVGSGGTLALVCEPGPAHDIVVEVGGEDVEVAACNGGQADVESVALEPGQYPFWCSIPGHREAGMVGELTVE